MEFLKGKQMTVETKLEKKVYSPWAYTENESEKSKINYELYKEIKGKAHWVGGSNGYGHNISYMVIDDQDYFDNLKKNKGDKEVINQIALIADDGNLCFGYTFQGKLTEYTDWRGNKYKNVYRIKVYTD